MNNNKRMLAMLLNCSIRDKKFNEIEWHDINWSYIISESQQHGIYPLLYPVIKDLNSSDDMYNDLKEKWKKNTLKSAIHHARQITQIGKVLEEFNRSNIPVIALKGLILRTLYPKPDLRTMGDADILVHQEDLEKVRIVLASMGYAKATDDSLVHIIFIHKHYFPIEVHWALADKRFINDVSIFESEIWDHAVLTDISGTTVLSLGSEDLLMHLLVHMAVHMKSGGFGLRQLCDLVLLVEKERFSIDWNSFKIKIEHNNLNKFAIAIFNACHTLFNLQIPNEFNSVNNNHNNKSINRLIDDIFNSGVYGRKSLERVWGNSLLNIESINKNSNKVKNVINIIFPPIDTLSDTYSYAKKHKILAPIAWIHHVFSGIFNKNYTLFDKLKFLLFSTSIFKKRRILIKELEL